MKTIWSVALLVLSTAVAHATSISKDITITVTSVAAGTIAGISLSNSNTTTGLSSGTPVGTLSVAMSSALPTFSYTAPNLHLSTSGADSGGVCNASNGLGNGSFQVANGDTLQTNGTLTAGSYAVCLAAAESGVAASGQAFTITVGNRIDAAASYCAANGGGDGSTGTPWHSACIQAALNAAVAGDTVFLAAGNWSLSSAAVVTTKSNITLTGAGSGNTFDAYGHPNNGSGVPQGTYTRVATDTKYGSAEGLLFQNCTNDTVSHIFFDGSLATAGGNLSGTLAIQSCNGSSVNDVRVLAFTEASISGETQFFIQFSNNTSVQNSVFAEPIASNGNYGGAEVFQVQELLTMLVKNNLFYQESANPIDIDSITFTGNATIEKFDGITSPNVQQLFGMAGCSNSGCINGGTTGSYHFFVFNNLFDAGSKSFGMGGGINDPGTAGIVNDLQFGGNTIFGATVAIDSCELHIYGYCVSGAVSASAEGMQVNGFTVTNNSLVAATSAQLNATGTGCTRQGAGTLCSNSEPNMTTVNFVANKNYLSSPSNQYLHDANTITPSVSNNVGLDVGSITAGPSCSFTLGAPSGSNVPFATTAFAAQYGSVRWLASTTSTTPTSGDARWNYLPPISLAATHGNTAYLWVMDSANNISAPVSVVIP